MRAHSPPQTVGRSIVAALGIGLLAGLAIGGGLALWIARLNEFDRDDAAMLFAHLAGLYAVVSLGVTGASAVLGSAIGRPPRARTLWALLVAFYVGLNGVLRFSQAVQPVSITPHLSAVGAIDLVFIALAVLVVVFGIARGRAALGISLAAAALAVLALIGSLHETPPRVHLATAVPEALAAGSPAVIEPAAERFEDTRLLVIGFDGLEWNVLLPLLRSGELPHFRALLADAAYGYLETFEFTISPVVWETISTGVEPTRHGIGYHQHFEFDGVSQRVRRLPYYRLCNSPMGVRRLLAAADRYAPWRQVTADSTDARKARFWEIASRSGLRVGVYDWLNTTPASALDGFLHGYAPVPPQNYPLDLLDGLPPLPASAGAPLSGMGWIDTMLPFERAKADRFVALAAARPTEVLMYYTHFGDAANHLNWKSETIGTSFFHVSLEAPDFQPGPTITAANRFLDQTLGDLLSRVPPDATVVLVSDHGFEFRGYEHDNGPAGVWIARGPGIRPGLLAPNSIEDVTPTLLHVLGLPVGEDMDGAVIAMARPGGPLDRVPRTIASYGAAAAAVETGESDADALKKHEEYLRALGYVN